MNEPESNIVLDGAEAMFYSNCDHRHHHHHIIINGGSVFFGFKLGLS